MAAMKSFKQAARTLLPALSVFALLVAVPGLPSTAQNAVSVDREAPAHAGEFVVPLNKSQILLVNVPFTDLSIGNPNIADIVPLTTKRILVLGKQIGTTNLIVYGKERSLIAVLDVVVSYDIEGAKQRLFELLPGEKIGVRSVGDAVVLSGTVSNAEAAANALAVTEHFAPEHVTNLMRVDGSQQVMLAVRFAEVKRTAFKALGVDFSFDIGNAFSFASGIGGLISGVGFGGATLVPGVGNLLLEIEALEEKGLVKTLAEPTLMALSGETASFLAGGEFPIPVVSDLQAGQTVDSAPLAVSVGFKEFGVGLSFTPTVIGKDRINLVVKPEVTAIDTTADTINIAGADIPSLVTRRAETTIELRDGQSFAIAGLLQNDFRDNIEQFPWLGDLPILGLLFRSKQYQRSETELVIIVTPYLVKPAPAGALAAPTDTFVPPSDADNFIFGLLEAPESGRGEASGGQGAGGMSGRAGHIIK